jgi:putative ABC transport system permease protein
MKLFIQLTRVALQSLASKKMRSALTMLGVIIGVGAVIVMVSIGEGAKQRVARDIQGLGTNLLVVRPGFDRKGAVRTAIVQTLTLEDAKAIEAQGPKVAQVSPEAGQGAQVKYLAKNTNTTVLGVTEGFLAVNNYKLKAERFLDAEDVRSARKVAVPGATPAKDLFEETPSVGQTLKVKGVNFEVVGLLEAKGQSGYRDPDDQVLVPITTAQKRLFGITFVRAINVQAASEDALEGVQQRIEELLTERTREIGIRKAVGARGRDILFQFLVEAVVLSVLGGLVGILCGVGGSALVGSTGQWETSLVGSSIALAFAVAAATGIFFGLYPARKASRLDPIEALRHE